MNFDRSITMYDESHSPDTIDKMIKEKTINKGKFLWKNHAGSYFYQMLTIKNLKDVNRILEVGPGEGFAADNMRKLGYEYDTLDFEGVHEPTIKADFNEFDPNSISNKYDITCAFQVLEHFPYDKFLLNLKKLKDMSNKYVFISIPYSCRGFSITINLQYSQLRLEKRIDFYIPTFWKNRRYRKQYVEEYPWAVHYWEMGRKGFNFNKVLSDIESCGLRILKKFHSPNPYHYFILCRKIK